jgi:transcriptional regulator GlxA family with amidase domain
MDSSPENSEPVVCPKKAKHARSRLHRIKDWETLAHQALYSPVSLARLAECSVRQLERFWDQTKKRCPKNWLREVQMNTALDKLQNGQQVKEVASDVGFSSISHFSNSFSEHFGFRPCEVGDMPDSSPG